MADISKIWFAMLTKNTNNNPQTDDPIGLVINEAGTERLNHNFSTDTPQFDQEAGQANLYDLNTTGRNIDRSRLDNSSVRVHNLGRDQWAPELIFIFGESRRNLIGDADTLIPIAIETNINTLLSSDVRDQGAVPSMPVRLVNKGASTMAINRLILIVMTDGVPNRGGILAEAHTPHGTDDPIELEIVNANGIVVKHEIPNTPQKDLERGQANLYFIPVAVPFTKRELMADSITLRIKGDDAWTPTKLFLFGLDDANGRPESIIPLVKIKNWNFGKLSTDTAEGTEEVTLPQINEREFIGGGGVMG